MDFTFKEELTKEFILSKVSQEQIFENYLGVPVTKKLVKSPLRSDNNPTCSFYKSKEGILYFHDFGTGEIFGCFNIVMKLFGCNYHHALKIIATDFGLGNYTDSHVPTKIMDNVKIFKPKETSTIQITVQPFTEKELEWWEQYNITQQILDKYQVYSCKYVFLNGTLFAESSEQNPMFGYYGDKQNGKELWRIYCPMRKSFRFISNWSAKKIQGLKQVKKKGNLLVITKSMKDVMCLNSLGIQAIAPNSETLFVSEKILEEFKFKHICVFYDNDLAGIENMRKIRKEHPNYVYYYIPRKYNAKDISDFMKLYGKEKTREFILNEVKRYEKKLGVKHSNKDY